MLLLRCKKIQRRYYFVTSNLFTLQSLTTNLKYMTKWQVTQDRECNNVNDKCL